MDEISRYRNNRTIIKSDNDTLCPSVRYCLGYRAYSYGLSPSSKDDSCRKNVLDKCFFPENRKNGGVTSPSNVETHRETLCQTLSNLETRREVLCLPFQTWKQTKEDFANSFWEKKQSERTLFMIFCQKKQSKKASDKCFSVGEHSEKVFDMSFGERKHTKKVFDKTFVEKIYSKKGFDMTFWHKSTFEGLCQVPFLKKQSEGALASAFSLSAPKMVTTIPFPFRFKRIYVKWTDPPYNTGSLRESHGVVMFNQNFHN